MALITAADVRVFYPSLTGTGEDTLLTTLIGYVDAALAVWCGNPATTTGAYTWTSASYNLRFDGPMKSQPLAIDLETRVFSTADATLDSVYTDDTWVFSSAETLAGFYLDKPRGWVWLTPTSTSTWTTTPLSIKLLLTGGFVTTPPEVVEAAALAVKDLLERGPKPTGYTTLSAGGRSVTLPEASRILPRASRELMAPWRGPAGG